MAKGSKEWQKLKEEFHEELDKVKCAGCKKEIPISFIRGFPVCKKCYQIIQLDNNLLFNAGEDIPNNLNVYKYKLDNTTKRQFAGLLKHWQHFSGDIYGKRSG